MRHILGILRRGLPWQLALLCYSSVGFSQEYQFTTVKDLDVLSINNAGIMLAIHGSTGGLLFPTGLKPLPKLFPKNVQYIFLGSVNNNMEVSGTLSQGGLRRGFKMATRTGSFHIYNVPGQFFAGGGGMNDYEYVVGSVFDKITGASGAFWGDNSGHYHIFTFPGAPGATGGTGINNSGQLVGYFIGDAPFFPLHGFLYSNGEFSQFDVPGALVTYPTWINNKGHIVGLYNLPGSDVSRGFLYIEGKFTYLDFPGGNIRSTVPRGINDNDVIVGIYDQTDPVQGFVGFSFKAVPQH